ncbi:MAG: laccase domain-containing protein [Bdellovibrionota bacterium]
MGIIVITKNIKRRIFTTQLHICTIGTADCLPILITDHKPPFVAAIHAGWRGLAKKIISKTLNHITYDNDILALIGPCIGLAIIQWGQKYLMLLTLPQRLLLSLTINGLVIYMHLPSMS